MRCSRLWVIKLFNWIGIFIHVVVLFGIVSSLSFIAIFPLEENHSLRLSEWKAHVQQYNNLSELKHYTEWLLERVFVSTDTSKRLCIIMIGINIFTIILFFFSQYAIKKLQSHICPKQ